MSQKVELLWFQDCANHEPARQLLRDVLTALNLPDSFDDIDASEPEVAARSRFPGSPTIRVDGRDVEPGYVEPDDFTPRCRVYLTGAGLRGLPERAWIEAALGLATGGAT